MLSPPDLFATWAQLTRALFSSPASGRRWARRRACSLRGVAVGSFVTAALAANAWVRDGIPALWPDGMITMHLQLSHQGNHVLSDGSTWNTSAIVALQAWNAHLGRVQFDWVADSTAPIGPANSVSNVTFGSSVYGKSWGRALAVAITWEVGGARVESDVILNSAFRWDSYRGPWAIIDSQQIPDVRRVLMHEFGHVLGLGHPDDAGQTVVAIMNAAGHQNDRLMPDDQAGASALYGPGTGIIWSAPTIFEQPSDRTVVAGETVEFAVVFSGWPAPQAQWYRDGQPLPGATGATLRIVNARASDAGTYSVALSNHAGTVSSRPATLVVLPAQAPRFVSTPGSVAQTEGNTLHLSASADGSPPLVFIWRRFGAVIAEGAGQLSLGPLKVADSGEYTVEVRNAGGSAVSRPFFVTVHPAPPLLINGVRGVFSGPTGSPVYITVDLNHSSASMSFRWTRDGQDVSQPYHGTTFSTAIGPQTAGTYRLTATNAYGTAETGPITLAVLPAPAQPPRLKSQVRHRTEFAGADVYLRAYFSAYGPLQYQWYRDDRPIPEATNAQLRLPSVAITESGIYRLVASNAYGSATSEDIRLEILPPQPPVITEHPASHDVRPGDHIDFGARAHHLHPPIPQLTVTWTHNDQPLANTSTFVTRTASAGSNVAGTYRMRVANTVGSALSEPAEVRWVPEGTVAYFRKHPASREVPAGGRTRFEFAIGGATPSAIRWKRDGTAIAGASGYIYEIDAVDSSHAGDYSVEVEVAGEKIQSRSAKLTVSPAIAPIHRRDIGLNRVRLGETVYLSADVEVWWPAYTARYQWRHRGREIPNATGAILPLSNVGHEHTGDYDVVVTTPHHTVVSHPGRIEIDDDPGVPPEIRGQPLLVTVAADRPLSIEIFCVTSTPTTFTWRHNGREIATTATPSLHRGPGAFELVGTIDVVATNAAGTAVSSPIRVVAENLGSPLAIALHPEPRQVAPGQRASFLVVPNRSSGVTFQWKRDGQDIPGATAPAFVIESAQPADAGDYTVEVRADGATAVSHPARLTVAPAPASVQLANLAARARVTGGNRQLIVGFVIEGGGGKRLLLRGIGPALRDHDVPDFLPNPTLEVRRGDDLVAANDDWNAADSTLVDAMSAAGAFALEPGSKDAALLATLIPGVYTAVVSGTHDATGIALVELYDLDPDAGRLINLSTRAHVGTGADVVIPGVILRGQGQARLLVRAVGPSLVNFRLRPEDLLAAPTYEVFRHGSGTPLARFESWQNTNPELADASSRVGAFALPDGSRDAAGLVDLGEGLYTFVVRGGENTSGIALVEVYLVPRP